MFFFYNLITIFLYPFLIFLFFIRKFLKKESGDSLIDKLTFSRVSGNKKRKKLIWFHAASIGEVQSIIPLVSKFYSSYNDLNFLITTSTISSGKIVKKKIKDLDRANHKYLPLDISFLVNSFLNNWSPSLAVFVDSEIWPNFLSNIKKRNIPLILVNGRITPKTYKKWKMINFFSKRIFKLFDLCLPCSEESLNYLVGLKTNNVKYFGNLKYSVEIKSEKLNEHNLSILKKKKVWCAASTHQNEEEFCLETHKKVKKLHKDILTIIIPRHINRSESIRALTEKLGLSVQKVSKNENFEEDTDVIIVNAFGELEKYFNYCDNVFIGKSISKKFKNNGGQNPIEAAKCGCKIFHGPYFGNFKEVYNHLNSLGISEEISSNIDLSEKLIKNFSFKQNLKEKNTKLITQLGDEILEKNFKELSRFLNI